jgi:plastocyanin
MINLNKAMRGSTLLAAAIATLSACSGDRTEAEAGSEAAAPASTVADTALPQGTDHPLLPVPEPTGENEVGARIREYTIDLTTDTVSAGEIVFHVLNSGKTTHHLMIRNQETSSATQHILPGDSATLTVTLAAGEYTVLCTVRDEFDHISEGERRPFIVR